MAFASALKNRLYRVAMRLHLPLGLMLRGVAAAETLQMAPSALRRRLAARRLLAGAPQWRGFVGRENGCRTFEAGTLPGTDEIVALCRRLVEERRNKARKIKRAEGNPFDMLLDREVFEAHPELVRFAVSEPLAAIAADYFGTTPRLDYIDLWVSSPAKNKEHLYNSQLYHIDKVDHGILTLFLAIEPIDETSGPFTLMPAGPSGVVRRATNYARTYLFGSGRLTDEEVYAAADPAQAVSIVGPAGAGGFCDTGRCFHFGSRCQDKERIVLAIRYYPAEHSRPSAYRTFRDVVTPQTEAQALLLAP
jgi:hypothetical protein